MATSASGSGDDIQINESQDPQSGAESRVYNSL